MATFGDTPNTAPLGDASELRLEKGLYLACCAASTAAIAASLARLILLVKLEDYQLERGFSVKGSTNSGEANWWDSVPHGDPGGRSSAHRQEVNLILSDPFIDGDESQAFH